jgi:hypothetical protein
MLSLDSAAPQLSAGNVTEVAAGRLGGDFNQ